MFTVCALYQFVRLDDFEDFSKPLRELMAKLEIKGTILLALEGLNGTVSGRQEAIDHPVIAPQVLRCVYTGRVQRQDTARG